MKHLVLLLPLNSTSRYSTKSRLSDFIMILYTVVFLLQAAKPEGALRLNISKRRLQSHCNMQIHAKFQLGKVSQTFGCLYVECVHIQVPACVCVCV